MNFYEEENHGANPQFFSIYPYFSLQGQQPRRFEERQVKKEMVLEALVDILDTEEEFTEDTVLEDIEEWDSLAKLYLVNFPLSFLAI